MNWQICINFTILSSTPMPSSKAMNHHSSASDTYYQRIGSIDPSIIYVPPKEERLRNGLSCVIHITQYLFIFLIINSANHSYQSSNYDSANMRMQDIEFKFLWSKPEITLSTSLFGTSLFHKFARQVPSAQWGEIASSTRPPFFMNSKGFLQKGSQQNVRKT